MQLVSIFALLSGGSDIITSDYQWWRPRAKVALQRSTLQNEKCTFASLIFFFWISSVSYSCIHNVILVHVCISACTKCRKCDALGMYDVLGSPQGRDYRAGVSRGTLSVHALSGRGSPDIMPTHIDVGHGWFCICMVRSVIISPFMHHVVTTKIGTRSQGLTRQKKKKGDDRTRQTGAGAVELSAIVNFVLFCELIRELGHDVDLGLSLRIQIHNLWVHESPERSKSPVHFFSTFFVRLWAATMSRESIRKSGTCWWSAHKMIFQIKKEKLRSEAAEKAFVSGRGKRFQFQLSWL